MMKLQSALAVALVVFAVGATFYLFVRPALIRPPDVVTDKNLRYVGRSVEGESAYVIAKAEITYWVEMMCKLVPVLSLLGALWIQKKKKNGKKNENNA